MRRSSLPVNAAVSARAWDLFDVVAYKSMNVAFTRHSRNRLYINALFVVHSRSSLRYPSICVCVCRGSFYVVVIPLSSGNAPTLTLVATPVHDAPFCRSFSLRHGGQSNVQGFIYTPPRGYVHTMLYEHTPLAMALRVVPPRGHRITHTEVSAHLSGPICHIMKEKGRTSKVHQRATLTISQSRSRLIHHGYFSFF